MLLTRAKTVLVGVVFLSVLSACGGAKARFQSHLAHGKELLASGQLDKAGIELLHEHIEMLCPRKAGRSERQ